MANNSGSGVPKFSSFKPKPKNPIVQTNAEPGNARNDRRNDRRNDDERQQVRLGRHRVEKSRSNQYRARSRSPPRAPLHVDRHRNFAEDRDARQYASHTREDRSDRHHHHTSNRDDEARRSRSYQQPFEDRPSDLYMIDVRGDLANLQYGRSNKWNVPLYYLFGSGSLVGHDPDVKIDRELSNEHGYTLRYPPRKQVVKRAGVVGLDAMFKPPPLREGENGRKNAEENFLPLPERKKDESELLCLFYYLVYNTRLTQVQLGECPSSRQRYSVMPRIPRLHTTVLPGRRR